MPLRQRFFEHICECRLNLWSVWKKNYPSVVTTFVWGPGFVSRSANVIRVSFRIKNETSEQNVTAR